MAAGNQQHAIFYSIYDGKICRSFKTPTETSKSRTNKKGNVVHEEYYDYLDGIIVEINTKEHDEYGKFWLIKLMDGETAQILQMNFSSSYSSAFLKMLPNVDLKSTVKLIPNTKLVDGKQRSSLFITQHGKPLKHFWNKENPGELPNLEQKKVKGKLKWDDSEQMEFLEKYVDEQITPNLPKSGLPVAQRAEINDESDNVDAGTCNEDKNLPF